MRTKVIKFKFIILLLVVCLIGGIYYLNNSFNFRFKEISFRDLKLVKELKLSNLDRFNSNNYYILGVNNDEVYFFEDKSLGVTKYDGIEVEKIVLSMFTYNLNTQKLEKQYSMLEPMYTDYLDKVGNKFVVIYTNDKNELEFLFVDDNKNLKVKKIDNVDKLRVKNYGDNIIINYDKIENNIIYDKILLINTNDLKFKEIASLSQNVNNKVLNSFSGITFVNGNLYYQKLQKEGNKIKDVETYEYNIIKNSTENLDFKIPYKSFCKFNDMYVYNLIRETPSEIGMYIKYNGKEYEIPNGESGGNLGYFEKNNKLYMIWGKGFYFLSKNGKLEFLPIDYENNNLRCRLSFEDEFDIYEYNYDTKILRLYKK